MILYDLEIKNAILGRGETKIEGINYCKGWGDHAGMGISVLVAYNYKLGLLGVFMDDNQDEFKEWVEMSDAVIGYASDRFDNPVLKANWGIEVPEDKSYDVFKRIKTSCTEGQGPLKLDSVAKANNYATKSGDGAMAPIMYQRGQLGGLINYCTMDVRILKLVVDGIEKKGTIISPRTNKIVKIQTCKRFLKGQFNGV